MTPFLNFKSQVVLRNQWPDLGAELNQHFLLYDKAFLASLPEPGAAQEFVNRFPYQWGVKAGETIKSFRDFPKNLETLLSRWPQPVRRDHTLVVLGGGSLGDFGGFVASILRRGVPLIQIPTTWIAAMDSAHGGKTALNFAGVKNQIGTFYPAKKIFIIKEILENVPQELKEQAYGELIKMALIGPSEFFKEIIMEQRPPQDFLWRFLKNCIEDKYEVILQDPYETLQQRQVLNFGHTLGHALESYYKWSHGESVLQGIFFALEWSRYRGDLTQGRFDQIMGVIRDKFDRSPAPQLKWFRPAPARAIVPLISQDKKLVSETQVLFVFLKSIGKPLLKSVPLADLLSEAKRQGWVK